jgi:hypothetical protein
MKFFVIFILLSSSILFAPLSYGDNATTKQVSNEQSKQQSATSKNESISKTEI